MPNGTLPNADRPSSADLEQAGAWLTQHGLVDAEPKPLLAMRLVARRRARLASSVLLAVFLMTVALIYSLSDRPSAGGFEPQRRAPLLLMTAAVITLVAGLSLLDWWVRRVDRRAGATLLRRAAHPVRLGWRTVLGWPRAALTLATFACAVVLAIGALTVGDAAGRYPAAILLISLCGVAVGACVQLRHLLAHPAVADDEVSLTADTIMRVEDARDVAGPTVLWCLPVVSMFATAPGWWNIAWLAVVVLGVATLWLITVRTATSGTVARHAMSAR